MKSLKQKISTLILGLILCCSFAIPVYGTDYCVSDRCKKAAADAINSEQAAIVASTKANDLNSTIAAIQAQIVAINAQITANEAIARDLSGQIAIAKAKLDAQQKTLAKLLVELHFTDKDDAMFMLASSKSIGELTEKQARADAAQENIVISAKKIREEKSALEARKKEVDRILAEQQNLRTASAAREAEINTLKVTYEHNASQFAKDAESARRIKAEEIAKEIARLNSVGIVGHGINSYPHRNICPNANLAWADQWGYVCQCVHYTGYKVKERWGINVRYWGNAYSWDDSARAAGYRVDTTPAAGTVAVNNSGAWGHVMWVESVNPNGTINISEYNNPYSSKSHREGDYGFRTTSPSGLYFIHFDSK